MASNRSKFLRGLIISMLVLLVTQFELGMAVNIAGPATIPTFGFSLTKILKVLDQAGGVSLPHAILGTLLVVFSVIILVPTLRTKARSVQITGLLAFVTMVLAASMGVVFTLSGFQNDNYSHGMASPFILTFSFYFLELYFLKPGPR